MNTDFLLATERLKRHKKILATEATELTEDKGFGAVVVARGDWRRATRGAGASGCDLAFDKGGAGLYLSECLENSRVVQIAGQQGTT